MSNPMSDEDDSVMPTNGAMRYSGPPNPEPYNGPMDPIDPAPKAMVGLSRSDNGVSVYILLREDIEVIDLRTFKRIAVGRVAARYDADSSYLVGYDGHQWTVETWREKVMKLERRWMSRGTEEYISTL